MLSSLGDVGEPQRDVLSHRGDGNIEHTGMRGGPFDLDLPPAAALEHLGTRLEKRGAPGAIGQKLARAVALELRALAAEDARGLRVDVDAGEVEGAAARVALRREQQHRDRR